MPTHSRHKNHGISRTRFDYDPFGPMGSHRLVRARNAHSSIELSYDALGRILSETLTHKGQQSTLSYEYDANGNSIRTHLPDGRSLNRLYYGSGHLHHINLDGQTLTDIERDALHRPIERSQGSLSARFGYDPMGRLQSQNIGNIIRRRYHYDKVGNLIQSSDSRNGTTQYVYDKIGRILEAVNPNRGTQEKFAFDPASNITDPKNHRSALGNRLPEYNGTQYTYDDLGNLIYRELPDGETQHLIYDNENQLSEVNIQKADGEHQRWRYAYDPFGRRISKERTDKGSLTSTAPKQTVFIWDGSRIVQEYHYKGHYTYIYTDQDSYEPLAQVFYNNQDDKDYLSHYHTDQIGIPREQTDQFGNLLWAGEYDAWGKLNRETKIYPNAHQPFRLQNQYYDPETGLHYNLFRYYDPNCGRFINQDPIGLLGGDNLYWFAPNANGWIDPLGLARLIYVHILKPNKKTNISALRDQIRGQISAMNEILKKEGMEKLKERIKAYDSNVEAEGRKHVKSLGSAGKCKAWLHEPDMRVGGKPTDVKRKGDRRINSILGGQADRIARDILNMPNNTKKITYKLNLIKLK